MLEMAKTPLATQNVFSAKLSPELTKEHNARSMPIRRGDTVVISQGIFRDVEGKVTRVDRKNTSIYVEGVTREKSNGNTIFVAIHPSKVVISKLNMDDKWRKDILERKASKPLVEAAEKPKNRAGKRSPKASASTAKKEEKG